ncbi:MAG: hypothetical protein R3232_06370 [Clostridia bacterium]|nr:hypothetical protein [Clostridia bacterium]
MTRRRLIERFGGWLSGSTIETHGEKPAGNCETKDMRCGFPVSFI